MLLSLSLNITSQNSEITVSAIQFNLTATVPTFLAHNLIAACFWRSLQNFPLISLQTHKDHKDRHNKNNDALDFLR